MSIFGARTSSTASGSRCGIERGLRPDERVVCLQRARVLPRRPGVGDLRRRDVRIHSFSLCSRALIAHTGRPQALLRQGHDLLPQRHQAARHIRSRRIHLSVYQVGHRERRAPRTTRYHARGYRERGRDRVRDERYAPGVGERDAGEWRSVWVRVPSLNRTVLMSGCRSTLEAGDIARMPNMKKPDTMNCERPGYRSARSGTTVAQVILMQ